MHLRHMPLFLVSEMAKCADNGALRDLVEKTAYRIIQRPDELAEILAIFTKGRTGPKKLNKIPKCLLRAIARAFHKFDAYQLAKYANREGAIRLKDVLRISHPRPDNEEQSALWRQLRDGELVSRDTWEIGTEQFVAQAIQEELGYTREEWYALDEDERTKLKPRIWARQQRLLRDMYVDLMRRGKLPAMALLRNLAKMRGLSVPQNEIAEALRKARFHRVLPFRFITAARYVPTLEPAIEEAMLRSVADMPRLPGRTALVIDHSGSMDWPLSGRSEMKRFEAAAALAILVREICEDAVIVAFSDHAAVVPARRGFALRDAIASAVPWGATMTQRGIDCASREGYDRLVVISDEQSHTGATNPIPGVPAYMVNVASNRNGIGYGPWTHIDGWSEAILSYILEREAEESRILEV